MNYLSYFTPYFVTRSEFMALSDTVATLEANFATLSKGVSDVSAEITKLAGEITTLQGELSNAGVDPALVARVQAVSDGLATQASALEAAVSAGG